jgi:dipeptidyl aminopeptidase/acylaminoacyl peptidase
VHGTQVATAERSLAIIAKDLSTGQTRDLYKMNGPLLFPMISVSPDGKWLAALEHQRGTEGNNEKILKVISTENGKDRELCRFASATNNIVQARWSADGRYIFFPGRRSGEEKWDIWVAPFEGGEARELGLALNGIEYISPHPDGSRIVFSSLGPTVHGPEVWVMENFLPGNAAPGAYKR